MPSSVCTVWLSAVFVVILLLRFPLLCQHAARNGERQHSGIRHDALHCVETFVAEMHRNTCIQRTKPNNEACNVLRDSVRRQDKAREGEREADYADRKKSRPESINAGIGRYHAGHRYDKQQDCQREQQSTWKAGS